MRRTLTATIAIGALAAIGAAPASAARGGQPTDNGNCIAVFSNGGAQAGFIQDVRSGGPGAVGEAGRTFGQEGGNGPFASTNCSTG